MYVVKSNGQVIMSSEEVGPCMRWLIAKANEYNHWSWLPGPGLDLLTLTVPNQQWTLSDTRQYHYWTVSVPRAAIRDGGVSDDQILGVFAYLDDAKRSVEMTYGKAVFTPDSELEPADTVQFATAQMSGSLQRVPMCKAATKLGQ